jgi:hypothetical protein
MDAMEREHDHRKRRRMRRQLTLDDMIERGKWNKPSRGGKREIVIEEDDSGDTN